MPESTIIKTKCDGTLTFSDNGGAHSYTVAYEAGDFNVTIPGASITNSLDRGKFGTTPSLRYGDEQAVTGTFSAYLRDLSDAGYATLMEIIAQTGDVGSNWVSTMGANGEVFTLTLLWTIEGTDHGDPDDHTMRCDFCFVTGALTEGDPDTITINFSSYQLYPTLT